MPLLPSFRELTIGLVLHVFHMHIVIDSHILPYWSLLTYTQVGVGRQTCQCHSHLLCVHCLAMAQLVVVKASCNYTVQSRTNLLISINLTINSGTEFEFTVKTMNALLSEIFTYHQRVASTRYGQLQHNIPIINYVLLKYPIFTNFSLHVHLTTHTMWLLLPGIRAHQLYQIMMDDDDDGLWLWTMGDDDNYDWWWWWRMMDHDDDESWWWWWRKKKMMMMVMIMMMDGGGWWWKMMKMDNNDGWWWWCIMIDVDGDGRWWYILVMDDAKRYRWWWWMKMMMDDYCGWWRIMMMIMLNDDDVEWW